MRSISKIVFIVIFFIISAMPCMFIPITGYSTSESAEDTDKPQLITDGKINISYLSDIGGYYEKRLALRDEIVTANSLIRSGLLKASGDNVIVGKDGWLYYESTLSDYEKRDTFDNAKLKKLYKNLHLISKTLSDNGIRFLFTIAPNKNSIYPQYMPDAYHTSDESSTVKKWTKYYASMADGNDKSTSFYLDLYDLFTKDNTDILYHATDSHWDNRGAKMVSDEILKTLGAYTPTYTEPEKRYDFTGDLYSMLYPALSGKEAEYYYDNDMRYSVDETTSDKDVTTDNYAVKIKTSADDRPGHIYMSRDSFGNSLLPFMANAYGDAVFSREIPYAFDDAIKDGSDTVVFEIVERHLHYITDQAPKLMTRGEKFSYQGDVTTDIAKASAKAQGDHICISGKFRGYVSDSDYDNVMIVLRDKEKTQRAYQAFYTIENGADGDKSGFELYIDKKKLTPGHYDVAVTGDKDGQNFLSDILTGFDISEAEGSKKMDKKEAKNIAASHIGDDIDVLIDDIGEPDEFSLSPSCESEGEDGIYKWYDFTVYTQSEYVGGKQIIREIE